MNEREEVEVDEDKSGCENENEQGSVMKDGVEVEVLHWLGVHAEVWPGAGMTGNDEVLEEVCALLNEIHSE